jgi:hypothetical protein
MTDLVAGGRGDKGDKEDKEDKEEITNYSSLLTFDF